MIMILPIIILILIMMIINPCQILSRNPSIKLFENPFYKSHLHHQLEQEQEKEQVDASDVSRIHLLFLPISSRKIAESFWDLTFFRQVMESDQLVSARAEMAELKAKLECERKARRKLESVNKRLVKEVCAERKRRDALERVCEELAAEITIDKESLSKMKKEIEEERKMLRVAEIIREERVQMKLNEAKLLMEDKIAELESFKVTEIEETRFKFKQGDGARRGGGRGRGGDENAGIVNSVVENPHIKRGIKGFVEFPRVVRAIGSKSRHLGTKLECQKAQLMILLKNRSVIRSNNLLMS